MTNFAVYLYFCYNKQQIKGRTKKAEHSQEFLKGFKGVVVADGYSAYQKIAKENPDITFAGCYAHCRRKFSDVLKGLKGKQKENAPTDCETTGRGFLRFAAYDTYFKGAAFTLLLKYNKVLFLLCCKLFF